MPKLPLANRFGAGFDGLSSLLGSPFLFYGGEGMSSLRVLSKLRQERTFGAFLKLLKNQWIGRKSLLPQGLRGRMTAERRGGHTWRKHSKANTSGSTACYKSLDFSRLSGYNQIRGFCEFSPSSLLSGILELSQ